MLPMSHQQTPCFVPMTESEIRRRDDAMNKTIELHPSRPDFPVVAFKVIQLVEFIHSKMPTDFPKTPERCSLKGSYTNEQEKFPNDVDIGLPIRDPLYKRKFNRLLSEFLFNHADKSACLASKIYQDTLPVNVYFNPITITEASSSRTSFVTYKSKGLDLTLFRNNSRWSLGPMDGKWFECVGKHKCHSMGRSFATRIQDLLFGEHCVFHHLHPIDDPRSVHNLTLRVMLEATRKASLVDPETSFVVANEIYQGKPVSAFGRQWASHQQDHYPNLSGKVIEFLNLLYVHQYSPFGCTYIAQAWKEVCLVQNISGMEILRNAIINKPEMVPLLLNFIQVLLIINGKQAYQFPFNEKERPLRPFVAIPNGDRVYYLCLQENQGSPVQMAHSFLDNFPKLFSFFKGLSTEYGYTNLEFLGGVFKLFGLNSKYLEGDGGDLIIDDLLAFFQSKKALEMQSWFSTYIRPDSILKRISALTVSKEKSLEKKGEKKTAVVKKIS